MRTSVDPISRFYPRSSERHGTYGVDRWSPSMAFHVDRMSTSSGSVVGETRTVTVVRVRILFTFLTP